MSSDLISIPQFDGHEVRRVWHEGQWVFAVVDVIAALTDTSNPRRYWSDMKRRIKGEGFTELYARCVQLKLTSTDGKEYHTDCADTETMLRIVQSIPSPNAEPFKQWLAKAGAEQLEAFDDDGMTEDQRRLDYRNKARHLNRQLDQTVHTRGVSTPQAHAQFHDAGYQGMYAGERENDIHERKGLDEGEAILDWMNSEELGANIFRITQTQGKIVREDVTGRGRLNDTHREVGEKVREAIENIGGTMPEDLPTPARSIQQVERDEQRRMTGGQDLFDLDALEAPREGTPPEKEGC